MADEEPAQEEQQPARPSVPIVGARAAEENSAVAPAGMLLFLAIMGGCFGSALIYPVLSLYDAERMLAYSQVSFSDVGFLSLILFELFAALLAGVALALAGWRRSDFPFRIDLAGSLYGVTLAVAAVVLSTLFIAPGVSDVPETSVPFRLSLWVVLALSLVNGAFEEIFVLGFVVRFFERRNAAHWPLLAIAATTLIRAAYHLYQGADAQPFHLMLGVAFSGFFLWRRDLWPLVLAHFILDVVALSPFVY